MWEGAKLAIAVGQAQLQRLANSSRAALPPTVFLVGRESRVYRIEDWKPFAQRFIYNSIALINSLNSADTDRNARQSGRVSSHIAVS